MDNIKDILNRRVGDRQPSKNSENQLKDSSMHDPACARCDDTGVRLVHGEPALCTCDKGQTDEARRTYAAAMMRIIARRAAAMKQAAAPRVMPSMVIRYKCDKCHDTGWRYQDEYPVGNARRGQLVLCECRAEARVKAREEIYLKLCCLPESRPEWTLDKFVPRPGSKEVLAAAWNIVAGKYLWFFMTSPSGYGKTHIAVGICREFLKQGKSARYIYVPDLINELKQGFDEEGLNSYNSKMNFFKNVKLLALDDLGAENTTPWVREQLDTIINHRYVNKLPLIINTNKPLDELMPRVASRIKRAVVEGFGKVVAPTGVPWDEYIKKK